MKLLDQNSMNMNSSNGKMGPSTVGPDEDLGKISNCLTAVPNERSQHMWESAQLFFSKCIMKKKILGPLKFAIFEVKSQFFSILLSKLNFKNSYLLGAVTRLTPSTFDPGMFDPGMFDPNTH